MLRCIVGFLQFFYSSALEITDFLINALNTELAEPIETRVSFPFFWFCIRLHPLQFRPQGFKKTAIVVLKHCFTIKTYPVEFMMPSIFLTSP